MTQYEMANLIGMSPRTYEKLEHEDKRLTIIQDKAIRYTLSVNYGMFIDTGGSNGATTENPQAMDAVECGREINTSTEGS